MSHFRRRCQSFVAGNPPRRVIAIVALKGGCFSLSPQLPKGGAGNSTRKPLILGCSGTFPVVCPVTNPSETIPLNKTSVLLPLRAKSWFSASAACRGHTLSPPCQLWPCARLAWHPAASSQRRRHSLKRAGGLGPESKPGTQYCSSRIQINPIWGWECSPPKVRKNPY